MKSKSLLIHEVFQDCALKYPDNIAVIYKKEEISYRQLNERANYLANNLIEKSVLPGDIVALNVAPSIDMIVAILAVLKAGAAYLPLDSGNPEARNLLCLDRAEVRLVISDRDEEGLLGKERSLIDLRDKSLATSSCYDNPDVKIDTNHAAYVMFTSGSTGEPKGVVVPHRAVIRLVVEPDFIDISQHDRFFQFAPMSFDASTFEVWGALLNGAGLVIYSGHGLDPNLFSRELEEHQVTILWLTAALFHIFAARYVQMLKPLRVLLAGGDVLQPKLINKVLDTFPELTVINGYGPTENTTFTCCHRMSVDNRPESQTPIGKPISGTRIHILDSRKQPVGEGEVGELYASGDGVALGYINVPENNESFFTDANIDKGLIYKTGDLVKQNPNGELEFVGRVDNQVKIRGFRVSLEEIQNAILAFEPVDDAVVTLKKYENGDQQLVSHLRLVDGENYSPIQVKKILSEKLPGYMIPDMVHINENLPINKNGKLDRKKILENTETC